MGEKTVLTSDESRIRRQTVQSLLSVMPGLHTHSKFNSLVGEDADTGRLEFWNEYEYMWVADLGGSQDYLVDVMPRKMSQNGQRPMGLVYMITQIEAIN